MKKIVLSFIIVSLLIACESDTPMNNEVEEEMSSNDESQDESSNDDSQEEDNMEDDLEMQREEFYTFLLQNSSKIWKIDSAILENPNGTFDISQSPNISDDEIIFIVSNDAGTSGFSGELTWKSRKGTNFEFDNNIPFENDSYFGPETFEFTIDQEALINSSKLQFSLDENSVINGKILSENSDSSISITLIEKVEDNYKSTPENLSFETFESFPSIESVNNGTGFKASKTSNSLYISYRQRFPTNGIQARRKVFRYSIENQNLDSTQIDFVDSEFNYSRFYFKNDRLIVFGSAHISELDLLLGEMHNTIKTGLEDNLSGADLASVNSDIYIIGGDFNAFTPPPLIIRKYDNSTYLLQSENSIAEERRLTDGEIVDNYLYIFGGQNSALEWYDNILIYSLENETTSSIELPKKVAYTATVRYENLIFVAGRTIINDNIEIFFGALDTRDNTFREIPVTIDGKLSAETYINGLTILDNVLYIAITDRTNDKLFIEVQKTDL